jgi:exonuclease SbcC
MRGGFLGAVAEHEGRIAVREAAQGLLRGAAQQMSHRFNRDVRNLVSKTLPLFTDGRYEHLQIDADLNVRVFSADKRDFMGLDEISSGTQRQIMLALRLALSQQLLERTGKDRQFVFLDEPFAFFDAARTRRALAELPGLSERIPQIFIVAQSFPHELAGGFTLHLECARDKDVLEAAPRGQAPVAATGALGSEARHAEGEQQLDPAPAEAVEGEAFVDRGDALSTET